MKLRQINPFRKLILRIFMIHKFYNTIPILHSLGEPTQASCADTRIIKTYLLRSSRKPQNYLHAHTISFPNKNTKPCVPHDYANDAGDDVNIATLTSGIQLVVVSLTRLRKEKKNSFATKWLGKWKMFPYLRCLLLSRVSPAVRDLMAVSTKNEIRFSTIVGCVLVVLCADETDDGSSSCCCLFSERTVARSG